MSAEIIPLPSRIDADAAWARYSELMRRWVDDEAARLDRGFCEEVTTAWADFRDAFLREQGRR